DAALAAVLGCDPAALTQLRLCHRPLPGGRYEGDIETIAGRWGCDAAALRRVLAEEGGPAAEGSVRWSRLLGPLVGLVAGAAVGFAVRSVLFGGDDVGPIMWAIRLEAAVVGGAFGALLGSVLGLGKG